MRSAFLVLFLCAGTAAFAQSNPANPGSSFKLELTQPAFTQPASDSAKPHVDLHGTNTQLWKSFTISNPRELKQKDNSQIDPGIIILPLKSSIGTQPPGKPIAQNLYPGLELLPIEEPKANLQPATK